MKIFSFIKDLLAPKSCYSCKKEGQFLCQECLLKMNNFESICYVCKGKTSNFLVHEECKQGIFFDKLIILTHYKNKVIKKLIKDFKYYGKKDISDDFSYYLSKLLKKNIFLLNKNDFIIIPVPMYFLKKFKRGYNQSEVLGKKISKIIGIDFEKNIIKKIKNTKQQSFLSKEERIKNLQNTLKINEKYFKKYKNKTFIIVDDVISTGTTINEISALLKQKGIKKVIGLGIASD